MGLGQISFEQEIKFHERLVVIMLPPGAGSVIGDGGINKEDTGIPSTFYGKLLVGEQQDVLRSDAVIAFKESIYGR